MTPAETSESELQRTRKAVDKKLSDDRRLNRNRQLNDLAHERTERNRARLDDILVGLSHDARAEAEMAAALLEEDCCTYLTSAAGAAEKRWRNHLIERAGNGLTAVAAAAAGSSLIAGSHGTWSKVFGVVILIVGVVGAFFNAMGGEQEYVYNRAKRRAYEELWLEAWNYGLFHLVGDDTGKRGAKLDEFASRWKEIGST